MPVIRLSRAGGSGTGFKSILLHSKVEGNGARDHVKEKRKEEGRRWEGGREKEGRKGGEEGGREDRQAGCGLTFLISISRSKLKTEKLFFSP